MNDMRIIKRDRGGFTLVEIMVVVATIALLAAIALPNFARARTTSQANACIDNMRQIDYALQMWALEAGKKASDAPDATKVPAYIRGNVLPTCPTGAEYVLGDTVSTTPIVTCPLGATVTPPHQLPNPSP